MMPRRPPPLRGNGRCLQPVRSDTLQESTDAMAELTLRFDARATTWRTGWIISNRDDLLWLIGSVGASYAMLLVYRLLGVPALLLIVTWVMLFDGPHIFGTATRTYF